MRFLIPLTVIFLSSCANQQIQLTTNSEPYTEYKHIIDERIPTTKSTSADRLTKDIQNLLILHDAGPYRAGFLRLDHPMIPIPEQKFSISFALALDMAISESFKQAEEIAPLVLTHFIIRSQYQFLGIPAKPGADCFISAQYKGITLMRTHTSHAQGDFNTYVRNMVDQCIQGLIDKINYHEKSIKNNSYLPK